MMDESRLISAIIFALDDNYGVNMKAWVVFHDILNNMESPVADQIVQSVDGTDNRVYLPKNWRD